MGAAARTLDRSIGVPSKHHGLVARSIVTCGRHADPPLGRKERILHRDACLNEKTIHAVGVVV